MFGLRSPRNTPEHVLSYYATTANPSSAYPALDTDIEADVAIVGGDFSGINTALELSERGYQVALLEANRLCWVEETLRSQQEKGYPHALRMLDRTEIKHFVGSDTYIGSLYDATGGGHLHPLNLCLGEPADTYYGPYHR